MTLTPNAKALLIYGLMFLVSGVSYIVAMPPVASLKVSYGFAIGLMQMEYWAWVFLAVGVIALVGVVVNRPPWRFIGWVIVCAVTLAWASMCLMTTLIDGVARGYFTSIVWFALAGIAMIAAAHTPRDNLGA